MCKPNTVKSGITLNPEILVEARAIDLVKKISKGERNTLLRSLMLLGYSQILDERNSKVLNNEQFDATIPF